MWTWALKGGLEDGAAYDALWPIYKAAWISLCSSIGHVCFLKKESVTLFCFKLCFHVAFPLFFLFISASTSLVTVIRTPWWPTPSLPYCDAVTFGFIQRAGTDTLRWGWNSTAAAQVLYFVVFSYRIPKLDASSDIFAQKCTWLYARAILIAVSYVSRYNIRFSAFAHKKRYSCWVGLVPVYSPKLSSVVRDQQLHVWPSRHAVVVCIGESGWLSCASRFLYSAWAEPQYLKADISKPPSIPPSHFNSPFHSFKVGLLCAHKCHIRNLILEPQRFALILLFFV